MFGGLGKQLVRKQSAFEVGPQKNCFVGSILIHDLPQRLDSVYILFEDCKLGGVVSSLASLPLQDIMMK